MSELSEHEMMRATQKEIRVELAMDGTPAPDQAAYWRAEYRTASARISVLEAENQGLLEALRDLASRASSHVARAVAK